MTHLYWLRLSSIAFEINFAASQRPPSQLTYLSQKLSDPPNWIPFRKDESIHATCNSKGWKMDSMSGMFHVLLEWSRILGGKITIRVGKYPSHLCSQILTLTPRLMHHLVSSRTTCLAWAILLHSKDEWLQIPASIKISSPYSRRKYGCLEVSNPILPIKLKDLHLKMGLESHGSKIFTFQDEINFYLLKILL